MRFLVLGALVGAVALSGCSTSRVDPVDPPGPTPPTMPPVGEMTPLAKCEDGMAGDYACGSVDLVSHVPVEDMGATRGNDIWGWTDSQTGVEYALVGLAEGTSFVSLADPTAPLVLGMLPTATDPSTWRDIKTYSDHAYIVSEAPGHGMQIFDLGRLRGLTADATRMFEPDEHYMGVSNAHNLVINEESGFAYIVGTTSVGDGLPDACGAPGFHAVNIQDPQNPVFSTCFSDSDRDVNPRSGPGYTHDAQCLNYTGPDADYRGRELCFAANEDVLTIFDVEDKSDVKIISMANYPGATYSHQGWLTEDGRYFLLDDELDEISGVSATQRTLVFDLLDLDQPEFAYVWDSGITVIDHNQYIKGDFSYQSNYKAGLRIIDVSKVGDGEMTEVAFFDTFPQGEDVQFGGQWSNFPYFQSGLVIANDGSNGLFVLKPNLDEVNL